jgi:hypothetical protein
MYIALHPFRYNICLTLDVAQKNKLYMTVIRSKVNKNSVIVLYKCWIVITYE